MALRGGRESEVRERERERRAEEVLPIAILWVMQHGFSES